jgi:hypothetical protein
VDVDDIDLSILCLTFKIIIRDLGKGELKNKEMHNISGTVLIP